MVQNPSKYDGAVLRRVIDRAAAQVPEHAHDWPVLSLFVLGGYWNETELGKRFIAGPSAVLYRARAAHRNVVAPTGFEQIEVEFDPAWLGRGQLPEASVSQWIGGAAATEARALVRLCMRGPDDEHLRAMLRSFLERRKQKPERDAVPWAHMVAQRLRENSTIRATDLARETKRHPSWLGTAYRRATGEGLLETVARIRVERGARLLRETDQPLADIAIEAGFCDQSHMNRTFRRVLGRTPSAVREDRRFFRSLPSVKVHARQ